MDLRITGTKGVIHIDDFLSQNSDGSADLNYSKGGWGDDASEEIRIPSTKPGAALMFEDMAAAAADPTLREQWMVATMRTQALLDAIWAAALQGETANRQQ
jgi:predicted dehydrogenase